MTPTIEPEPPEGEREAIVAALAAAADPAGDWASTALLEGVEDGDLDP